MEKEANKGQDLKRITGYLDCGNKKGSAFLVNPEIAFTAYHCIQPHIDNPKIEIDINFRYVFQEEEDVLRKVSALLFTDEDLDIAVLKLNIRVPEAKIPFLKFSNATIRAKDHFEIYGYPRGSRTPGKNVEGKVNTINLKPDNKKADLDLTPEKHFKYPALSGAPVIIAGKISAIVVDELNIEWLGAVSIHKICKKLKLEDAAELSNEEFYNQEKEHFFKPDQGKVQCYVVISEAGKKIDQTHSLIRKVKRGLIDNRSMIEENTRKPLNTAPHAVSVLDIISSQDGYENALEALCRADIAIFDVTNYEPAVMLLIGIRSVVRRGVTILSSLDNPNESPENYPFSIKDVNIISHSGDFKIVIKMIGEKILEGFKQLKHIPHYLDLPAFEAIRNIPLEPEMKKIIPYSEQVMVLCPFDKEYREHYWEDLKTNLEDVIKNEYDQTPESSYKTINPQILRTLDMKSPRLVTQSLYEAIRLTNMCIVDWTMYKSNVFFEFGVRLASRDISPLCIISEDNCSSESKQKVVAVKELKQIPLLKTFFNPIPYSPLKEIKGGTEEIPPDYQLIFSHYKQVANTESDTVDRDGLQPDFTFKVIEKYFDIREEAASIPVYEELWNSAEGLSSSNTSSVGESFLLYNDNNGRFSNIARNGALERRLAAWFYLDQRFSDKLQEDERLKEKYEEIGNQIINDLEESDKESDRKLRQNINEKVNKIKSED